MEKLNQQLNQLIERLENSDNFRQELKELNSIYPFNQYEYIISTLLSNGKLSFDEYLEIRDDYINRNLYLYVFEISAPRGFGDTWTFGHLMQIEPDLKRPSKKIDPSYTGEYDLYLPWSEENGVNHNIKIEVKSSRAVDKEKADQPLYIKALTSNTQRPFLMNFQQLKPSCCDVFIWIAVFRNEVKYWILNSNKVKSNPLFTPQHRHEGTNERSVNYNRSEIFEGQIMVTNENINLFDDYVTSSKSIKESVIKEYKEL